MTTIGVSGHQRLPKVAQDLAERDLLRLLAEVGVPVVGLSSLAMGTDQLFARLVLDGGGELHAVIPATDFEWTFDDEGRAHYFELLEHAAQVTRLDYSAPGEEAYDAAGRFIVDHCDLLFTVWDGKPARGLGGTADAVNYARSRRREVRVSWPPNVVRE